MIYGGHVYVHWGRKDCGPGAELLYAGFAAGGHYQHPGGSTDTLCLPEVPVFSDHVTGNDEDRNLMYSVKYGSSSSAFQKMMGGSGSNLHNGDLPCSACQAAGRASHVLVPGRSVCMHGWTLEYSGYLMGSAYAHTSGKELLCVDSDAEVYTGSGSSVGGSYLYFAEVRSGFGGYTSGNELPCVICTR
ncbi:short-chain collagen C4-like [Mya arenaria]|uniref:short-chain collagen C4-like n=1 Tax=Mya arenaria TaxID=6604 RepID=UPI0022E6A476|nr:short-chain collagen C4-like [Mya arenaria]